MIRSMNHTSRLSRLTRLPSAKLNLCSDHSSNKTSSKRLLNTCVHIRGIPSQLSKREILNFLSSFGTVIEFASFQDNKATNPTTKGEKARRYYEPNHSSPLNNVRPLGQTAVVGYYDTTSAMMCREILHWRPFPIQLHLNDNDIQSTNNNNEDNRNTYLDHNQHNTQDFQSVLALNPRERPLLNVLFETSDMRESLKGFVKRDLLLSKRKIFVGMDDNRKENKSTVHKRISS